ncbi:MAG: cellulose synthase [Neorhizobium sp.]|nr:cellulose synthase [Neorhizobium sp.]
MRFSLIAVTATGLAIASYYAFARQPSVDFSMMTGSVDANPGQQSGSANASMTKTERLSAQLVMPVGAVDSRTGRSPVVMAQATGPASDDLIAQASNPAQPQGASRPPVTAAGQQAQQPAVDESALRYFAARGDTARLQAEISRLRALYPSWTPPADPLSIQTNGDPQLDRMWQLYAQSRYADVRDAIAQRQQAEPGWQPPEDLLDRLKLAESRSGLTAASDAKDYQTVIRIAAENPTLLTCSEVDALWRVADAFAHTDRGTRARDAYLYILNNCSNTDERIATVQKASELLPADMLEQLMAKERTPPGGQPEFEVIRDGIARRLVGEGNSDAKLVVAPAYLQRLERLASATDALSSDALILGWYYYRRDNLGAAERWLRMAYSKQPDASSAEGLALTLVRQNSPVEAENTLYPYRDTSDDTRAAYLAAVSNLLALNPVPVLQSDVLARMAPAVITGRDAAAAQQFGWYARTMRQPATAADWFSTALGWKPDDEPSAYGLALSRFDLNDRAGFAAVQRLWAGRSERIAEIGRPDAQDMAQAQPARAVAPAYAEPVASRPQYVAPQRTEVALPRQPMEGRAPVMPTPAPPSVRRVAASAPAGGNGSGSGGGSRPGECWMMSDVRSLRPEQALSRGWCLMDLNRPLEAVQAFEVASSSTSATARSDAAYGRSLAYLRVGLTDKASAAAADASQTNARAVELQSSILSDRAVKFFKLGRYREALLALDQRARIVPEQTDLMSLRGYAYLSLGRRADAQRVFQALADTGNSAGQAGLADMLDGGMH